MSFILEQGLWWTFIIKFKIDRHILFFFFSKIKTIKSYLEVVKLSFDLSLFIFYVE